MRQQHKLDIRRIEYDNGAQKIDGPGLTTARRRTARERRTREIEANMTSRNVAKDTAKYLDRRTFIVSAAAVASLIAIADAALAQQSPDAAALEAAMKKAIGDAKPTDGKITLNLPEIAENGNTVPFDITVESPMTDANFVKALHIFAPGNPAPDVASFMFTPLSGKASASSRMRLGKTQEVVSVAEMSDGKFYITKRTVKVTIGGCGG